MTELLFDRYQIRSKLDSSELAVYLAEDLRTRDTVVLKVLDAMRGADPVARGRFLREFEILSRLTHPGVARVYRFEKDSEVEALVLEHVPGESLAEILARGPVAVSTCLVWIRQLAEALAACHRAGVVHRDVKPANVVVHPSRGPVLLDFGVAWFSSALTLTKTGAVLGSPRYLAPELMRGGDADPRADLYGLGAIFFEALTGRSLRDADSVAELAWLDLDQPPPRPSQWAPRLPRRLDPIVLRALAPRPEDRYATMGELIAALDKGARALGRPLEQRVRCAGCGGGLLGELPFCPGCGRATGWGLEPGAFGLQLTEVADPTLTAAWLARRFGPCLRSQGAALERRLKNLPALVLRGVHENAAEVVAEGLRRLGCRVEVFSGVLGGRAPPAAPRQLFAAATLHFGAVSLLGSILLLARVSPSYLWLLPGLMGLVGVGAAGWYVRQPVVDHRRRQTLLNHPLLGTLGPQLGRLKTARARTLAATAVARITPLLVGEVTISKEQDNQAQSYLMEALDAALELDIHRQLLDTHPRSQSLRALAEAQTRQDLPKIQALESLLEELVQAAIHHDAAAQRALMACAQISEVLAEPALLEGGEST